MSECWFECSLSHCPGSVLWNRAPLYVSSYNLSTKYLIVKSVGWEVPRESD